MLKNFNSFDRRLLLIAILFFVVFTYLSIDDRFLTNLSSSRGEKIGRIQIKQNDVRLKSNSDFRYLSARKKAVIYKGDSIFTGPNSKVQITLANGDTIEIQENSLVTFSMVDNQLVLNLKAGLVKSSSGSLNLVDSSHSVNLQASKLRTASDFKFKTRNISSLGEEGVDFPRILRPIKNEVQNIRKLYYGAPTQPTNIQVVWEYAKTDVRYEVQVAKDPNFQTVEYSQMTDSKNLTTPEVRWGLHYVRVREQGQRWSETARIEFRVSSPDTDPTLTRPRMEKNYQEYVLSKNPLIVRWSEVPKATQYLVEMDQSGEFDEPKIFVTESNRYVLPHPNPGKVFFRVSALFGETKKSLPSEPSLAVAKVNPPKLEKILPLEYIAKDEEDHGPQPEVIMKWSSTEQTRKYQVTISQKPDFSEAKTFVSETPVLMYKMQNPGPYFWKVQSLNGKNQVISEPSQVSATVYKFIPPLDAPVPVSPLPHTTLFFQKENETPFFFVWKTVPHAKEFWVQVATDPQFRKIIYAPHSKSPKVLMSARLPSGQLYWRVQARFEDRASKWSKAQSLKIFGGKLAQQGDSP